MWKEQENPAFKPLTKRQVTDDILNVQYANDIGQSKTPGFQRRLKNTYSYVLHAVESYNFWSTGVSEFALHVYLRIKQNTLAIRLQPGSVRVYLNGF